MKHITKEFCTENLSQLHLLDPKDISRVELCDNLAVGGTTPSYGVIKEAVHYLHEKGISLAVMIRPRGGNFVYNDVELRVMENDILQAVELGCDALVFGLLTKDHQIDIEAIEQLLPATQGLPLVFHMAFDWIPKTHQKKAIDTLIDYGFVRILLDGSKDRRDPFENLAHIKELVAYANDRIQLMIGGGVIPETVDLLAKESGCFHVHGTNILKKARS